MRRLTIRTRLTVLYGGLFFLAGALLLGVTYLLVQQTIDHSPATGVTVAGGQAGFTGSAEQMQVNINGRTVTPGKAADILNQQQAQFRADTLNSLLTQGGIALGVVGVIAVGLGWLMAERALRPVHAITATARRVAAGAAHTHGGLHERIELTGPNDEIRELASTFDDMLRRLERSFDGQRRFVANASHELRTPLAINRALVEVAITRPGASEDAKRLGETLLPVNARNERLIEGLLTLAESGPEVVDRSTVDLRDVVRHVLDQATSAEVEVRELSLCPAPVLGDPVLLERLIHNLVHNAIRHNQPGGWLSVSTAVGGGTAVLTVANTGPSVAPYDTETIFEPFHRLGNGAIGAERGFGLGLSIVRAVARAHGGEVSAVPRPGGGLVVVTRIPAS